MNIQEEIKMQISQLNMWTKAYDEGHPIVSDSEWDYHYFKLMDLENRTGIYFPNSPTQCINYEVVNELKKVNHNHKMLSLDKTKDWNSFIRYFSNINSSKDVVGMLKLDGLTCSLRYLNGKLVSAETRGNGEVGEDILHNALTIPSILNKINYKDELILDGEIICTTEDFKDFANEYKNPRNFAAGSIRLLDSEECSKRKLTFIVWNVVKGFDNENNLINKFELVSNLGFKVTPWTSSFDLDAKEFLMGSADLLGYPIDGLVGRFDDISFGESLGSTGHHSKAAYAFKFYDEEYTTPIIEVEWSMGRTGILTPVAIFEPVEIDGTTVERASLHNLSIYKSLNITNKGQIATVYKANQIIPQIKNVEEGCGDPLIIPSKCPICGADTEISISDEGIENLVCSNPHCEGKLINKIDHFCSKKGMDIKGLSLMTIEKLIDLGWINNIFDIYHLNDYYSQWISISGFGEKSVTKILNSIEESKNCELWQFISAIGIPGIGVNTAKVLANNYKSWRTYRQTIEGSNSMASILSIDGFGYSTYENLLMFNYNEADKIYPLLNINKIVVEQPKSNSLEGMSICITGKLTTYKNRDELKAVIEAHGGKVVGSVTAKTNYLINNDVNSQTAKNKTARSLGVKIISENEFKEKFLTN